MDPQQTYDMIACPRNWAKLSTQLRNMERRAAAGETFDDAELEFAVAGAVGKSCTADFCAFYLHGNEIIDAARIADGDVPAEELRDLSEEGLYITMQSYVRYLADEMKSRERRNLHPNTPEEALPYEREELERIAANMNWIIEVGEKVRLDAAVAMISDLNTATEGALAGIAMTEAFEELCPRFSSIAMLNTI